MSVVNSAESPWLVSEVSEKINGYINRLGSIWVEGQVTQLNKRPGSYTAFITLRDPKVDKSISVTCLPELLDTPNGPIEEGATIIIFAKPTFYTGRGTFSLRATELRTVGIGQLLANIEILRKQFEKEGLFDLSRKKKIPFLPKKIGLITGRASAAERDVISVSELRWSEVKFEIKNTPVQGITAPKLIIEALHELDDNPDVEVIIIARGGGSVEDLLPFSDELLCREVSLATTPVVSAIGHEPDHPLLDEVADLRAATPTDAAKRIVPDIQAESTFIVDLLNRLNSSLHNWVKTSENTIKSILSRPVLSDPSRMVDEKILEINSFKTNIINSFSNQINIQKELIRFSLEKITALGPKKTLERGYAIVQLKKLDNKIVKSIKDLTLNDEISILFPDGNINANVTYVSANKERK